MKYKEGQYIIIWSMLQIFQISSVRKSGDLITLWVKNNDCELIWFCHDVEEVFIGKKVKDSEKRKTAAEFRKKECVKKLNFNDMRSNKQLKGKSNLLLVMDKYLDRKI